MEGFPTDDELIGQKIEVDDPLALDSLLPRARPLIEMPILEHLYKRGSSGKKVPCAYCRDPQCPNHLKGYVLRYADGARVLIGNRCGEHHFGQQAFKKMVETIVAKNDLRSLLVRRRAVLTAMPAFKRQISVAAASPQVRVYGQARRQFHSEQPNIAAAATYAVSAMGGTLMQTVQVRDLKAESDREEKREQEAKKAGRPYKPLRQPIYKDEEQPFGTLRAGEFFLSSDAPDRQLMSVAGRLEQIEKQLPSLSTQKGLVGALREVRICTQAIEKALDQVDRLQVALSQDNLELMAAWASTRNLPGTYSAKPGSIERVNADGSISTFVAPKPLGPVDRQPIRDFENALAATG